MMVYNRRAPERENLIKAKEWFTKKTGLDPKVYRVLITNIKKDFMLGNEPKIPSNLLSGENSN